MALLQMKRLRLEITIVVIVCQTRLSLEASKEPPKVRSDRVVEHRVRAGDSVRLSCAIDSDTPLIVDWEKDGRPIHIGLEQRFRLNKQDNGLRISNVTSADRGRYVCRATNGFGRTEVEHQVDIAWSYGLQKSGARRTTFLTVSVGDSLLLPCFNESHLEDVTWYKDGVALSSFVIREKNTLFANASLKLDDVTSDASGVYECHNGNDGDVAIYVIDVIKAHRNPVFVRHPENATAALNGRATFFCQIRSELPLQMQWLKRLEATDDTDPAATGAVDIGEWRFLSVNRTEFLRLDDGSSYFSKFQIRNIRHRDVGFYVCVGTNTYGYVTGGAYLALIQQQDVVYSEDDGGRNTSGDDRDSPFLSLVVVISVLSLLVFFSLLSFTVYRSRFGKKSTRPSSSSSASSAVERRVTSPPIDGLRGTSVGLLLAATPELDRRNGHQRYQASSVLSSVDRDSCCDAPPSSHRDPYQLRILTQSGAGSPHQPDPWRKGHQPMAEMASLRLFGRHSDSHGGVTEHPAPCCPYNHRHDKFRFERDDES